MADKDDDREQKRPPRPQPPDKLELAATWFSAALIAALLAFLVWDALQPSREAAFETRVEGVRRTGAEAYVTVAVKNLGDEAARMVQVKATPKGDESGAAHFTIEWIPGRSTRRGIVVLPADKVSQQLDVRVEGYSSP